MRPSRPRVAGDCIDRYDVSVNLCTCVCPECDQLQGFGVKHETESVFSEEHM